MTATETEEGPTLLDVFRPLTADERIEQEENQEQLDDAAELLVDTDDYLGLTADDVLLYCSDCTRLLIGHGTRGGRDPAAVPEEVWGWRPDPRCPGHERPICRGCARERAAKQRGNA